MRNKVFHIEEKDYKDLYSSFTVCFGSQNVDVFVWRSVRGLYRNTYSDDKPYLGAYVYYPNRKRTGLFGEIHLIKRMIGAGYVAHEIDHLMTDWLLDKLSRKSDPVAGIISMNEQKAWLAGEITRLFWSAWYKHEKKARDVA